MVGATIVAPIRVATASEVAVPIRVSVGQRQVRAVLFGRSHREDDVADPVVHRLLHLGPRHLRHREGCAERRAHQAVTAVAAASRLAFRRLSIASAAIFPIAASTLLLRM